MLYVNQIKTENDIRNSIEFHKKHHSNKNINFLNNAIFSNLIKTKSY